MVWACLAPLFQLGILFRGDGTYDTFIDEQCDAVVMCWRLLLHIFLYLFFWFSFTPKTQRVLKRTARKGIFLWKGLKFLSLYLFLFLKCTQR